MNPILRIPLGLIIMVAGFLIIWKTETVFTWVGRIPFAEAKFGSGGTRTFIKIIGLIVAFIGIFVATNIIADILSGFAKIFTPGA